MDTIVIVHPLKPSVYYLELALKIVAEHLEEDVSGHPYQLGVPNPFEKYNSHRKVVILPGYENNLSLPDENLLTDRITLLPNDVVMSDFNSCKSLCHFNYPDWDRIVEEFKNRIKPTGRIIVGGFACYDCVKDFAMACDNSRLPAFLDENITELYYDAWPRVHLLKMYNIRNMGDVIRERRDIDSILVREIK